MTSIALVPLIQGRIRDGCVGKDRLSISLNVIWTITRDSRHTELVPETSQILKKLLHIHELRSQAAVLHTGLFLG